MERIIVIIIRIAFLFRCRNIAEKNGRNPDLAGVLGFFFGLWAVIGYAIAGKKSGMTHTTPVPQHHTVPSHPSKSHKTKSSSYFDSLHNQE